ncbi:MAG: hypothetical protein OHK0015_19760 [Chloroflexi bacterium OHK40]
MTHPIPPAVARLSPLLLLVLFTLLPYGWFAQHWPWLDAVASWLFATEAAHAVGHALSFGALGAALLTVFPALCARPGLYLAIVLAVALGQEGLQLLYKGRGVIVNDMTDLGTDMVAAVVVLALMRAAARNRPEAL